MSNQTMDVRLAAYVGSRCTTSILVAVAAASARSAQLSQGLYRVVANCDCWIRQGGSSVTAADATAGSTYLPSGSEFPMVVDNSTTEGYLAVISADNTGTVCITAMGA